MDMKPMIGKGTAVYQRITGLSVGVLAGLLNNYISICAATTTNPRAKLVTLVGSRASEKPGYSVRQASQVRPITIIIMSIFHPNKKKIESLQDRKSYFIVFL